MDLFSLPVIISALLMLWVVVEFLSLAIPALQGGFSVCRWAHSKLTRSKWVALPAHLEGPIASGAVAVGF